MYTITSVTENGNAKERELVLSQVGHLRTLRSFYKEFKNKHCMVLVGPDIKKQESLSYLHKYTRIHIYFCLSDSSLLWIRHDILQFRYITKYNRSDGSFVALSPFSNKLDCI